MTSRRPVGLVITIEGVISMTVFLTGTHFLSGRPSLHAPPAAPPRRPDSRIPADNGDKGEVCRRGAFDGRSAYNGFFRNQHKVLVFMQDNKSLKILIKTKTSIRRVERLERKLWYDVQNVTGSITELCRTL